MEKFVHLHTHTHYSILDGAIKPIDLVKTAYKYGMPAAAITDHGNMFGAIEFYTLAQNNGIKPIIGSELYIAPSSRFEKTGGMKSQKNYHIVLLAKNETGYKNLMKLSSIGYIEGFYYKPRIDKEVLRKYSEGLIMLSACLAGEIPYTILNGGTSKAKKVVEEYIEIFGKDNIYFELQYHGIDGQDKVNRGLIELSEYFGIKLVATNDSHFLRKSDYKAHEVLLCIQTGDIIDNPKRYRFDSDQHYFKSPQEMMEIFKDYPHAIYNTVEVANRCNLTIDFSQNHFPYFPVPEGHTLESYLREKCYDGLKRRYTNITDEIKNRLEYELDIIISKGFAGYFLIVADFVGYAKANKIPVGPGRGSAAGSIVSYCLGITNLEPISNGLLFERFLNPERKSLPDIDIDFSDTKRDAIIKYVEDKYGKEKVAKIITFGTLKARGVMRDVGRVLAMPYSEVDRIVRFIPEGPNVYLNEVINVIPEIKALRNGSSKERQLIEISLALEGVIRNASTHAAGIVIADKPITEYVPLFFDTKTQTISTQYSKDYIEQCGLLKMDFLGLRTLRQIENTLRLIRRHRGIDIDLDNIGFSDKKTYALLSRGEGIGVFQCESEGIRSLMMQLKPQNFEEITAMIALYRPGPLGSGMVEEFVRRKHGQTRITYIHKDLEDILKPTYGIIVYQEQVMQIAQKIAGFTMGEADTLRKAMGKKIAELMMKVEKKFIDGAVNKGYDRSLAQRIFDLMKEFAKYGFNKSHSAAYAVLTYQTAYLKANYPLEFAAALLTTEMGAKKLDKFVIYIDEVKRMGIEILPPNINKSIYSFSVEGNNVRYGLGAVKNVGESVIKHILKERRQKGEFKSLFDFVKRINFKIVNRRAIESLIKSGALDVFKKPRKYMFEVIIKYIEIEDRFVKRQTNALFGGDSDIEDIISLGIDIEENEWEEGEKLRYEKEMLGIYISGHPLARYSNIINIFSETTSKKIGKLNDGSEIEIVGLIINNRTKIDRNNRKMGFLLLEDFEGKFEAILFADTFEKYKDIVVPDNVVVVKGRVDKSGKIPKIIANEIVPADKIKPKVAREVHIRLKDENIDKNRLKEIKKLLTKYEDGKSRLYLHYKDYQNRWVKYRVNGNIKLKPSDKLKSELENSGHVERVWFVY